MTQDMNNSFAKAFRAVVVATLTLLTGGNAMAEGDESTQPAQTGVVVNGSVYGGGNLANVNGNTIVTITTGTIGSEGNGGVEYGNVYGGGKGKRDDVTSGQVKGNTKVTISQTNNNKPTIIYHNVYGGGAYGSVGTYTYDANNVITGHTDDTGKTEVYITGGTIGWNGKENGMIFGSSRGDVGAPNGIEDKLAWVYDTHVAIGDTTNATTTTTTPIIKGSIYGGGENGHNLRNSYVRINGGTIGIPTGTPVTSNDVEYSGAAYSYRGNVYGGGCGTDKYYEDPTNVTNPYDGKGNKYNPKAGIVQGNAFVNITAGHIVHNVYGAGAMGSVGTATATSGGKTTVTISGGRIGYDGDGNGNVFGAARGEYGISTVAGSDLAIVRESEVDISYPAASTPTADNEGKTAQLIAGSVFGGGEAGTVKESVAVNMTGGLVLKDVYGGGALADTQTSNWNAIANNNAGGWTNSTLKSALHTTTVRLTGGIVVEEVFGGGLGEAGKPAYVWGDVLVDLNGTTTYDNDGKIQTDPIDTNTKGCIVNNIFGCNNVNGTPKGEVLVHVHATQSSEEGKTTVLAKSDKNTNTYDVEAVYGGGNQAEYYPVNAMSDNEATKASAHTNVIVDGCTQTSIKNVYGGGNAASTPSTSVTVNGAYEIGEVFGGGNGFGDGNPGANVGFHDYSAVEDTYPTKAQRQEDAFINTYVYGSGKASVNIFGGTVHRVFGGSNTKGNVRITAITMLEDKDGCDFCMDEAYGGGKSAPMDAEAKLLMACIPGLRAAYGGAEAADVLGDVTLNITNGTFDRVFGGNNLSGTISGSITVNIEETGCKPIIIGELYGGGNEAAYSVFGYKKSGTTNVIRTSKDDDEAFYAPSTPYSDDQLFADPQVNVKSFTSIGKIYGGGLGTTATMVGNPTVNVSVANGIFYNNDVAVVADGYKTDGNYPVPSHAKGKIGAINNVYGGGNAADVVGNTNVNIGTDEYVFVTKEYAVGATLSENCYTRTGAGTAASPYAYTSASGTATENTTYYERIGVVGADIRGNVYGGGEGVETTVTGDVQVNIGGQKADGTFVGGNIAIGGSVYGGSALGAVNATRGTSGLSYTEGKTTAVTLKKGNVSRYVFGGGQGDETTTAHVYGKSTVTLYGDVVAGGLYGGCDANGEMHSDTQLDLLGGTVGTALGATDPIPDMVFGGGLGQATTVDGDVTVNVGKTDYTGDTSVTIWGNVYGGGALGSVNTNTNNTTLVNLFKGTVNGNVFGGGLGQAAKASVGTEGQPGYEPAVSEVAAAVKGNVRVDLNGYDGIITDPDNENYDANAFGSCIVTGSIFGCNNTKGSPEGDAEVHIYKTIGTGSNQRSTGKDNTTYDMSAVYGGGNKATYSASGKTAKVIIETCDVSINEVYGGGYGADVPDTQVEVKGAYEIGTVFGGGYGAGSSDPAAADYNPGANVNGSTDVILKGGVIHEVYGGSNTKGNIVVGSNVNVSDGQGCCDLKVDNIYGGGKNASMEGGTSIVLGCQPNTWIEDIYAGSREADVDGNVELTITSGKFKRVFGGNKTSGKLKGSIKVNIEETGNCSTPIIIGELYAGGNEADYSIYGYKDDGTPMTADELRTRLTTENPGKTTAQIEELFQAAKKNEPQLNVRAFTSIGAIYGGGYSAKMYADPTVSINVVKGSHYNDDALEAGSTPALAGITPDTTLPYPAHAKGAIGAIGNVFGGGNLATVYGSTTVNIGTETTVGFKTEPIHLRTDAETPLTKNTETGLYDITVEGANITGNVYGGGRLADVGQYDMANDDVIVVGNTYVNIGAKKSGDDYIPVAEGTSKVLIAGNVFGGGEGEAAESGAGAFKCAKAIVTGGTNIHIGNGTINGTVYGGGEVGRVEGDAMVAIGIGTGVTSGTPTSAPEIKGDVYGAGKGKKTHGYSALMRGNPTVIIEGDAKVRGSVYGGGEIASVGKYNVKKGPNNPEGAPDDVLVGMPYSLANSGSGYCTVIIRGNAEIGPATEMKMKTTSGIPDDTGHVIGGGKGVLPYDGYGVTDDDWIADPWRVSIDDKKDIFNSSNTTYTTNYEKEYFKYIETLALATETNVTIAGNAFVKGSVYGGSLNGHVQHDTHVTIAGGQIGAGEGVNRRYTDTEWASESLAECPHWDYDASSGAPYDPLAQTDGTYDYTNYAFVPEAARKTSSEGGLPEAKDGHTYYGNVFGGGSGVIPYAPGLWHRGAGSVGGDTYVNITGGHILTSVYGGNEHTDVGTYEKDASGQPTTTPAANANDARGKCTVNMVGGTLGVPRTVKQMTDHPVTCYLFGAGKGDQRIFFNTWTNVIETEVNISGNARIYGSTFGGGEDGHVIENAVTNIGGSVTIGSGNSATTYQNTGVIIGTTGTSYVDGNIFGGGRGFGGEAQTAGTVGGNVEVNISGGTMYGSVYGGGRLASVGTQFTAPDDPNYGNFLEDETTGTKPKTYGHVTVNISGGTIGRDFTNITPVPEGIEHSGNVFGGSMGRLDLLNGTRNPIWPKMAQVKTSAVNVYGTAEIKRNVFGGGELGSVRDNASVVIGGYLNPNVSDGSKTTFIVNPSKNDSTITVPASDNAPIVCRDVYGGGYGSKDRAHTIFSVKEPNSTNTGYEEHMYAFTPMQFAGCVGRNTFVDIKGGQVRKSVYGGGEMASVGIINCQVETLASPGANRIFVGQKDGKDYYHTSIFKNEDKQTVDGKEVVYGFALSWPFKFSYMPGFYGGTHVNITGGRIGAKTSDPDIQTDNGDVYGAGEGIAGDYKEYAFCANVGATDVNINMNSDGVTATNFEGGGNCISGAVYGGGENGHVMGDTRLTLVNGFVGHSIYGAGSGKGKFETELVKIGKDPASAAKEDHYKREIYSITAGKVFGNSTVEMSGGTVVRNVYGGGNMGSVGKGNYAGGADDYSTAGYGETLNGNLWDNVSDDSKAFLSTGICTVNITGGTIGYIDSNDPSNTMYPWNSDSSLPYGNVFGGCRGESAPNIAESPRYLYSPEFFIGYVNETNVTIGADDGSGPTILGSVYGGGMDGHVRRDASVTIKGGEIGIPYTSDNKTKVKTDDMNNIQWLARGNVYGSGSGIGKYEYDFNYDNDFDDTVDYNNGRATVATKERDYSSSAGSVTRFTKVDIQGGTIHRNVYAGGSLSSIGAPMIGQRYLEYRKGDTNHPEVGKQTLNEIIISGGNVGDATSTAAGYGGHVFGGSRGDASLNTTTFSTSMFTDVAVKGGKVFGSVFGGGEVGIVKGSVDVNVTGGEVVKDVYGGGALANTNTANPEGVTSTYTTTVNLLGGTIGDAYGGGLGQRIGDVNGGKSNIEAIVYGDVNVNLNGLEASDYVADAHSSYVTGLDKVDGAFTTYRTDGGCVVLGNVFGCNNINGTPMGHAKVHVFKTMPRSGKTYDVDAVFGGGNAADYTPDDTKQSTEVIIEGCGLTSIEQVYGGGNAAATPGSSVLVKGTKIINELFGGGNGELGANYAANVGYHFDASTGTRSNYTLGAGQALVQLMAGTINYVYGGSNSNGDIRGGASITTPSNDHSAGCCDELVTKQISGGGKNADMDSGADIVIDCRNSSAWVEEIYAGSENADVGGNVRLTITSGKFGRVFGGNKTGGKLNGSITVNIEESPTCGIPVVIGELYAGGNKAPYSIYGYSDAGEMLTSGTPKHSNPVLNVRAFTSIGNIYGGGFGENAVMYGSPTVNINSVEVDHTDKSNAEFQGNKYNGETHTIIDDPDDSSKNYDVYLYPHDDGKMGVIGNVFGGGNAAKVYGDTNVNIGTKSIDVFHTPVNATEEERTHNVVGADIRGNVYGGGNNAAVTGNTNVTIGQERTTAP